MRGTSSTAKLVTPRALRARTSGARAGGCLKPTTTAPGLSCPICSSVSGCTVRITSAAGVHACAALDQDARALPGELVGHLENQADPRFTRRALAQRANGY